MNIKTRFKINDEVWIIDSRTLKPKKVKIINIELKIKGEEIKKTGDKRNLIATGEYKLSEIKAKYEYKNNFGIVGQWVFAFEENQAFKSKEQLIKHISI